MPSGASRSRRALQPGRGRAGVHDQVALAGARRPAGRSRRRARRRRRPAAGSTSTRVTCDARESGASSRATQQPTMPAPTTVTRSPTSGAASHSALTAVSTVPASTARRRRHAVRARRSPPRPARRSAVWCGYRQKTVRPSRSRRTLLDDADVEVAVLHRPREVALLERRPHRGVLARPAPRRGRPASRCPG